MTDNVVEGDTCDCQCGTGVKEGYMYSLILVHSDRNNKEFWVTDRLTASLTRLIKNHAAGGTFFFSLVDSF